MAGIVADCDARLFDERGGSIRREADLKRVEHAAIRGCPESVVAHLVSTLGQDMRQEAADELMRVQRHGLPSCLAAPRIPERNPAVLDGEDTVVGNGDAMHVAAQVVQNRIDALLFCFSRNWRTGW